MTLSEQNMAGNWTEFFTFRLNYGYKWRQHPSIHHPFIPPSSIHSSSIRPSSTTASTASKGLQVCCGFSAFVNQTCLLLPHCSQSPQRTLMGSALITQLSSIDHQSIMANLQGVTLVISFLQLSTVTAVAVLACPSLAATMSARKC